MTEHILAKSSGGLNNTGETLSQHTLRCLNVANVLLENLPFSDEMIIKLRRDLPLAIAVHDTGKAAIGFQRSLKINAERWGHRHEILSASFASSLGLSDEIILAVITHHKSIPSTGLDSELKGTLPDEEIPLGQEETPIWEELVQEWNYNYLSFSEEWNVICEKIGVEPIPDSIKLVPLNIDKRWLRRYKQKFIPYGKRYYASILRGLLISSDHIASNTNVSPDTLPLTIPSFRQFSVPHTGLLRSFQERASITTGNLILRAPTGSGKTIAAILWAQRNQGKNGRMFYVLPNIASINSMYINLKNYFQENVGLLHSRVVSSIYSLRENDGDIISKINNQKIARTMNSLVREMWFPIRICTPHQVLRYSLQGKGWETMLTEFPNSCFIFDEIHAYEPRLTGLVIATVKFLTTHNANCLFLSATLPQFIKEILEKEVRSISFIEPNPEAETDRLILEKKRHNIEIIDGNIMSNIDFVIREIRNSSTNLIVCNTIRSSQMVFDEIRKHFKDVVLLHSQFNRKDRNKIEQNLMKGLPKCLISTQVVEVSLDIDFDQGFSEPAPIDALIQRLGRINRFGKKEPSNVRIFTDKLNSHNIYDRKLVEKSLKELTLLMNPLKERDLIIAADRVYQEGYDDENRLLYEQALNHPRIREFKENLIAGTHHEWVDEVIDNIDNSIDLLPFSLFNEYRELEEYGLKVEADLLLVPVGIRKLFSIFDYIDKKHDPWIINKPYSDSKGLYFDSDDFDYSNII